VRTGVRLGVDVGSVRIGVAASDAQGALAVPVQTVRRDRHSDRDIDEIAAIAAERDAVEIVVGLPRSLSGMDRAAALGARDYASRLAQRVTVPVRLIDERLSTVQAQAGLRAAGLRSRRQRAVVDQAAAVIVLQAALDEERATGAPPGDVVRFT
jgi:putative Holliday junction resolvase